MDPTYAWGTVVFYQLKTGQKAVTFLFGNLDKGMARRALLEREIEVARLDVIPFSLLDGRPLSSTLRFAIHPLLLEDNARRRAIEHFIGEILQTIVTVVPLWWRR